jgi:hypothetical protein
MFCLQFSQNGLKHSWFFLVTHALHTVKFRTFSQTVLLRCSLFVLCFSKHERLLKFLLTDAHGTRSSEYIHGGTDLHSLHVSPYLCVAPRLHPLLQPLHTHSSPRTHKTVYNMIMPIYVIHQVHYFFGYYLSVEICPRNSIPRKQRSCSL